MREKSATKSSSSVRVAVRIRPQSVHERVQNVPQCLTVTHGKPQLTIGREKTFTYDYVFDQQTPQEIVYLPFREKEAFDNPGMPKKDWINNKSYY
uniref:Kinesin motor domain-containing protein n=1 Tax=Globodera pallida TaxID=36090 RepID=A0A183C583_GLOPA